MGINMVKRAFLIHGWNGRPNEAWKGWLKKELEKNGFEVSAPAMPSPANPKMKEWVMRIAKLVGKADENCCLIGHSLGCVAILRYLETLDKQKAGCAVLVAGFSYDLGIRELHDFFTKPVDWKKIKSNCRKFVAIHSDNDPYVALKQGNIFKEKLGAELIVEHNILHFSESAKLQSALDSVLETSGKA